MVFHQCAHICSYKTGCKKHTYASMHTHKHTQIHKHYTHTRVGVCVNVCERWFLRNISEKIRTFALNLANKLRKKTFIMYINNYISQIKRFKLNDYFVVKSFSGAKFGGLIEPLLVHMFLYMLSFNHQLVNNQQRNEIISSDKLRVF